MTKYKIFISGVQKELAKERKCIKQYISQDILLSEYFDVFLFEDVPAKSKSAEQIYLEEVIHSDIYLVVLGKEYGYENKNGLSATELEFKEAVKNNKEILIYIKGNSQEKRDKKSNNFITKIKDSEKGYTYSRFNNLDELKNCIYESLIDFLRTKDIIGRDAFDKAVCRNAEFDDINEDKIRLFLRTAKNKRNYPLAEDTKIKNVLAHLNLLNKGKLTNSAILLFGKDPQKYHLQAELKCLQFSGTEIKKPFINYQIYKGDLFEQIDRALAFVLSCIKIPVIQQSGTAQVNREPEIPEFALLEAIVNAVAHRDYNPTASVQVMVFIDRVEIWNPGCLPSSLNLKSLRKPHASHPNNPLLAEVLYLTSYIQKAGSGTVEMIKQCKEKGLPEPIFEQNKNEFKTIISRDIYTEIMLIKLGLNERQTKAVIYVKNKGKITNREYREITGLSDEGSRKDLKSIVQKKIFKIEGKGRSVTYVLSKKGD